MILKLFRYVSLCLALQCSNFATVHAGIQVGDILATVNLDTGGGGVIRIDPVTGDRTIISGFGVGSGPSGLFFNGITADNRGNINVSASDSGFLDEASIIKIDSETGDQTILSSSSVGSGLPLGNVQLAMEWQNGKLIAGRTRLFEIDTVTGDRELISSALAPSQGTGDTFSAFGLTIDQSDQILITDAAIGGVIGIDPTTGDRALVSQDPDQGSGPGFSAPTGIIIDRINGSVYVSDFEFGQIVTVDLVTGDRTNIYTSSRLAPFDLEQTLDGNLITIDRTDDEQLLSIDPVSLDTNVISTLQLTFNTVIGNGPLFDYTRGLFVVESLVPEPATLGLIGPIALLLVVMRQRRISPLSSQKTPRESLQSVH